jgi:hypothetical protein
LRERSKQKLFKRQGFCKADLCAKSNSRSAEDERD